jgi:hypothetical protein
MSENDEIDWSSWVLLNSERAKQLSEQLKKEVGQAHRLFEVVDNLEVLAADRGSDGILLVDPDTDKSAFVVHLTWSDTPETDNKLPWTTIIPKGRVPNNFS